MVELAISPDRGWVATIESLITATSAVGFSALGIAAVDYPKDVTALARYDRSHGVDPAVAAAFDAAGIRCHEVQALVLDDDEVAMVAAAEELAVAADLMGAEWVLTTFRTGLTTETARIIERCAAIFAEAGAGMAVEFTPYRAVTSIPSALEIVEVAGRAGRAGVLIDTWHFSYGDSTWNDLASVPLDRIAYVQFGDALPPESDNLLADAMDRRALPGEGVLDLGRFVTTLRDRGWDGLVSVEVMSSELRRLQPDEIVRRIADTTMPYWR